jgi:hypothetical protein
LIRTTDTNEDSGRARLVAAIISNARRRRRRGSRRRRGVKRLQATGAVSTLCLPSGGLAHGIERTTSQSTMVWRVVRTGFESRVFQSFLKLSDTRATFVSVGGRQWTRVLQWSLRVVPKALRCPQGHGEATPVGGSMGLPRGYRTQKLSSVVVIMQVGRTWV